MYSMKCLCRIVDAILASHTSQGKVTCAKHGGTPLHWAKEPGFIEAILKQEHDLDVLRRTGDAALHVMVKRLRLECTLALLCAGADVNAKGPDGDTALHMAIKVSMCGVGQSREMSQNSQNRFIGVNILKLTFLMIQYIVCRVSILPVCGKVSFQKIKPRS